MTKREPHKPKPKKFFCPLGKGIAWHRGLEYKDCPLFPSYRDMPECRECNLRIDSKWEANKETWKDIPVKKKKKRPKKKRNQGGRR